MSVHRKILITGASGFVGGELAQYLLAQNDVALTSRKPLQANDLPWHAADLSDTSQVERLMDWNSPEVVIHCAGTKDVRLCERESQIAMQINAEMTQTLARACQKRDIHLIYISTDLVFDGQQGDYEESETPSPTLAYGKSKLEGELLAQEAHERVSICRTAGVFGSRSPLLAWFRQQVETHAPIECFEDVHNSPTYIPNLARLLTEIMDRRLYGVLHTTGSERASRYDLFRAYAESLRFESSVIKAIRAGEKRREMLMLPDSSLNTTATLQKLGNPKLLSLRESFEHLNECHK